MTYNVTDAASFMSSKWEIMGLGTTHVTAIHTLAVWHVFVVLPLSHVFSVTW